MVFTSVSGHLLNHEFVGSYKRWNGCSPLDLFTAPVAKGVKEESMQNIKVTEYLYFHIIIYASKYEIYIIIIFFFCGLLVVSDLHIFSANS